MRICMHVSVRLNFCLISTVVVDRNSWGSERSERSERGKVTRGGKKISLRIFQGRAGLGVTHSTINLDKKEKKRGPAVRNTMTVIFTQRGGGGGTTNPRSILDT